MSYWIPKVMDESDNIVAYLENAYNIIINDQHITRTNGFETLKFNIPLDDEKCIHIKNERKIEVNDRWYVIKNIDDTKAVQKIRSVECDAYWYDLSDGELKTHTSDALFSARQAIDEQLQGTGWTSGTIENTTTHRFTINDPNTTLYNLRYIWLVYGGEMWFDSKNQLVHLHNNAGRRTNNYFTYTYNLASIQRLSDTTNLITRLYMYGETPEGEDEPITIAPINNGLPYIEDYSWYDEQGLQRKLKTYIIEDNRFNNMYYMKEYMQNYLDIYARPVVTYELNPSVLEEDVNLYDYVYISDPELGLSRWFQVLERELDLRVPQNSKLTLESIQVDLSDAYIDDLLIINQ